METLNMLITQGHYQIADEQPLNVIRWIFPAINFPSQLSRRFKKNRPAGVLTTSSAKPLIALLRSENFASMVEKVLVSNLACYTDMMSDLE